MRWRIASTSSRSFCGSRCKVRISSRTRVEAPADRRVAGDKRAQVSAWCSPDPRVFQLVVAEGVDGAGDRPASPFGAAAGRSRTGGAGRGLAGKPGGDALPEAGVVLLRVGVRVVVEEDEVEVGGVAELLPPSLPQPMTANFGCAWWRWRIFSQTSCSVSSTMMSARSERWSEMRSSGCSPARSCASTRNTWAWWASRSRSISRSASPACSASYCVQRFAEAVPVGGDLVEARVEDLVEQDRMAVQVVGRPGGAADQLGNLESACGYCCSKARWRRAG